MPFEIPHSFQELVHNKPALIGLAGAGGLGLVVFLRRRKSDAGAGSQVANSETGNAGSGGVATFDSTGSDVAAFLGDYSTRLDSQLNGYINDLKATIPQLPASETPPSPAAPSGGFHETSVTVAPGWSVVNTIKSLQAHGWKGTYDSLVKLNPGLNRNIKWSPNPAHREWDAFTKAETYRLV